MSGILRVSVIMAFFACILVSGGCGYHMGSIMHPQVKSIAIAPVVNETLSPYVSAEMRNMLCEQFVIDGSLKVKRLYQADCILHCKVTHIDIAEKSSIGYDDERRYRPNEWTVKLTAEFTIIIPTKKKPLVSKTKVTGESIFQAFGDHNAMRRRGIRQAARDAAEQVVQYSTEGW